MTTTELEQLKLENDRLKRLCRYQFITLGFYGTEYNYKPESRVTHPISGESNIGVMWDRGRDARQAREILTKLGFTFDEVLSWPGPGL